MAKLQKRIEAAVRRRAMQPRPQAAEVVKLEVTSWQQDEFTQSHATVLLLVESMLVLVSQQDLDVDDAVVEQALRAAIRSRPAADPAAEELAQILAGVGSAQDDIDAETWQTAMRVIYTSVKKRSDCKAGDREYLDFAENFLHRVRR
jgi:Arc/MetJ family transcription regulator